MCVISAVFLIVVSITFPTLAAASPPKISPSEFPDPYEFEAEVRENILRGEYETRGKIELSGDEVLELKNKTLVVEGDIILSGNSRLVIENTYFLWNNRYFAQYSCDLQDNAVFEVRDSILVRGYSANLNVGVRDGTTLTMTNTICYWDIFAMGGTTIIDSSQVIGANGVFWFGHNPPNARITNSRIRVITLSFYRGEPENLHLSGLKWGGPQWVSMGPTLEGASLELENSWVGWVADPYGGGWVLDLDEDEYIEGWQPGPTLPPENAQVGVLPNRKHYFLENSEIDGFWTRFGRNSVVKVSNWKAGHFSYWNLHQDAEVQGVGYDVTMTNTSVNYWKLLPFGRAELENLDNVQVSPWAKASVVVKNSIINHNTNIRGQGDNVRYINSSIPSDIMFLDARRHAPSGGDIHYLDFENTTISGRLEVASTYSRISGTVTILMEEGNVNYVWGAVEREYPVEVRNENGTPIGNVGVSLFDPENNLVWSGTTGQGGSASFSISFTENNWNRKWRLETTVDGKGVSKEAGFLTSTPVLLTPADADGDGMSDEWEIQHGLNPNLNDANQDADGDGYTNLQEYQAGTNPTLASSYPWAEEKVTPPAEGISILYLVVGIVAIVTILIGALLFLKSRK